MKWAGKRKIFISNTRLHLTKAIFCKTRLLIIRHEVGFQENTQKWEINGGGESLMFYV